ncbi:MAG: exonuclease subunit SbcD [Gammaproteobacteria bacterium]|nr:exonuclease subunit SbcD [Gammaproteobacteria bacterium]
MRFLHTGDWHVGKTMRGRSRADEYRAVLAEIADIAADRQVDAVLVAGDLFDTAAPGPESEEIVYETLLRLAQERPVVVIAGNHDNPNRFNAVKPLLELGNVVALPRVAQPEEGGVIDLDVGSGERAHIVLLPFVSQRGIVRAEELMVQDPDQHSQKYADRLAKILDRLCGEADVNAVNLVLAHAMVHGGTMGGGERSAHTVFQYSIPTSAFPSDYHYVALGHLHRAQELAGGCPIHYSGSPLQLDFGETEDAKSVNIVEATPGQPASVEQVTLSAGRRLRRVGGSLATLAELADTVGEDFLLVEVQESPRPGLSDDVRELLANAVEVRVPLAETKSETGGTKRGRAPQELFHDYLENSGAPNEQVEALFDELLEDADAA